MSSDPSAEQPEQPEQPGPPPVPDAEELARAAEPATLRRAPRYRAFVLSGVVVGVLVAFVLVLTLGGGQDGAAPGSGLPDLGTGPVLIFTALTLGLVGALVGGLVALLQDRRSRPTPRDRRFSSKSSAAADELGENRRPREPR